MLIAQKRSFAFDTVYKNEFLAERSNNKPYSRLFVFVSQAAFSFCHIYTFQASPYESRSRTLPLLCIVNNIYCPIHVHGRIHVQPTGIFALGKKKSLSRFVVVLVQSQILFDVCFEYCWYCLTWLGSVRFGSGYTLIVVFLFGVVTVFVFPHIYKRYNISK